MCSQDARSITGSPPHCLGVVARTAAALLYIYIYCEQPAGRDLSIARSCRLMACVPVSRKSRSRRRLIALHIITDPVRATATYGRRGSFGAVSLARDCEISISCDDSHMCACISHWNNYLGHIYLLCVILGCKALIEKMKKEERFVKYVIRS